MDTDNDFSTFMRGVYGWMFLGLCITGLAAFGVSSSQTLADFFLNNAIVFYGLMIAELVLVLVIAAAIRRLSVDTARGLFLLYALLNGCTFSLIFLIYAGSSIALAFFVAAATFGAVSLYGYVTKRDLTTLGHIAFMALIGLVIASLANLFFASSELEVITSYAGVLIFTALTAYDTQKIKRLYATVIPGGEGASRLAIVGALNLYIDFINLFLDLLFILGGGKKRS